MELWIGIALVTCAVALFVHVVARAQKGKGNDEWEEAFEQRIGDMERRLTDIQDIVIAIDDKLERQAQPERS